MSEKQKDDMVLMVAGRDRSHDLGRTILSESAMLDNSFLHRQISLESAILDLGKIDNEPDYLSHQLELFGVRTQLDLSKCQLPDSSSAGIIGRIIGVLRSFVWRLLKFAFGWTIFHQNVVNEQQAISLAHEVRLRRRENDELRRRIELLESRIEPNQEVSS